MELRDLVLGLDIGPDHSMIACYDRKTKDAETVTPRAGTDRGSFPTELLVPFVSRGKLYDLFCSDRPHRSGEKEYQPWELMERFVRDALDRLGINDVTGAVRALMVTTPEVEPHFARNMNRALRSVLGRDSGFSIQDYDESFYYYSLYKNHEVYRKASCLLVVNEENAQLRTLRVERTETGFDAAVRKSAGVLLHGESAVRDAALLSYLTGEIRDGECSAVYITGSGFSQELYPQSTVFLCRDGRKVFAGDNLYVKGACFSALDRAETGRFREISFRSPELLSVDVSVPVRRNGREEMMPLLKAGTNWFENEGAFECIPADTVCLTFFVSTPDGEYRRRERLQLDDLPVRPEGTSRLRVRYFCQNRKEALIVAEDLGFGGFYPASGTLWRLSIPLSASGEGREETSIPALPVHYCDIRRAVVPFPIDCIHVNAYSIEEICYFLEHYPELVDSEIVGEPLIVWLEEELGLTRLGEKLREALEEGEDITRFILPLFRYAEYLPERELALYKESLDRYMKAPVYERLKRKGDALTGYGKYVGALNAYRKAIGSAPKEGADPVYMASLYHNMGAVYMRMLLYEESLDCFKKAYIRFHTKDALRSYLLAARVARPRSKYDEIIETLHVDEAMQQEIEDAIGGALSYEVPPETADRATVLEDLMAQYRVAAGMPYYGS